MKTGRVMKMRELEDSGRFCLGGDFAVMTVMYKVE